MRGVVSAFGLFDWRSRSASRCCMKISAMATTRADEEFWALLWEFRPQNKLDSTVEEKSCFAMEGGSPQIRRKYDDANVIFDGEVLSIQEWSLHITYTEICEVPIIHRVRIAWSQRTYQFSRHDVSQGRTLGNFHQICIAPMVFLPSHSFYEHEKFHATLCVCTRRKPSSK